MQQGILKFRGRHNSILFGIIFFTSKGVFCSQTVFHSILLIGLVQISANTRLSAKRFIGSKIYLFVEVGIGCRAVPYGELGGAVLLLIETSWLRPC